MEAPNFMKKVKPYKTVQNRTWQFKSSLPYPCENRTKPYISVHGLNCPEILLWLQNPASDLNENIGPSLADGLRFSGATALIFGCCALPIIFFETTAWNLMHVCCAEGRTTPSSVGSASWIKITKRRRNL